MTNVNIYDPTAVKEINFTPKAIQHLQKKVTELKAQGVRFGVAKKGCSGLKYEVDYVYERDKKDKLFAFDSLNVYVDLESMMYLSGITIDYILEGLNGRLVFKNPNEKNSCGCGESFSV